MYILSLSYTIFFQNGLFKYYLKIYLIFILIFINILLINNNNLFVFNFLNFFEIFIFIFVIENLIDKSKYKL